MSGEARVVVAGVLATLLLCGLLDHLTHTSPNRCHMTYMFQLPQFINISLPAEVRQQFPHYHLYSYGEGDYSTLLEEGHYTGVPVLFIPGNGGSHKQVRSLASVAYRKSLEEDGPDFHFNFFTVDINEELGALYGPVLEQQTAFVVIAIKRILELYQGAAVKPESVVLVGHSMGGMIGRAVHTVGSLSPALAPLIISQATPHTRPVLLLDQHLEHFYHKVNTYWRREREGALQGVTLVSVGGGRNDVQVPTALTHTPLADISTTTANVPSCWLTADHQAIVWCRQLVLAIVRALFECVNPATHKLITDKHKILNIFNYHLATRITGKHSRSATYPSTVDLEKEGTWVEVVKRQHSHKAPSTARHTYLMVPLNPGHQHYQRATVVAYNVDNRNWVLACAASLQHKGMQVCTRGENLSAQSKKMMGKMKSVELDLTELGAAGHTHVVVSLPPTDERVEVYIDVHGENGRRRSIETPAFFRSFAQTLIVDTTPQKALSYNVTLHGFQEMWQSFKFILKPRSGCPSQDLPTAMLRFSWLGKDTYVQNSGTNGISYNAEIDIPPQGNSSSLSAKFILDPECTYSILIQGSLVGVFRRLVWLYGSQVPAYYAVHLVLTLARQLRVLGEDGQCPSFFSSMLTLTPLTVIPFVKITNIVLQNLEVEDDFVIMSQQGEELPLLPVILFLGCLPFSLLAGAAAWASILLSGNVVHTVIVRTVGRTLSRTEGVADLALSGLSRIPLVMSVALVSLAYSTCGTLSLTLAALFYFLKVCKLYEDYLEREVVGLVTGGGGAARRAMTRIHLHLTLLLLVTLVVLLNLPSLLIWTKLYGTNLKLEGDPVLAVSVVLLLVLALLWQKKMPNTNKMYYKQVSYVMQVVGIVMLQFGCVHIYRITYLVVAALALVALHQVVAPTTPPNQVVVAQAEEDSGEDSSTHPFMAEVGVESSSEGQSESTAATTPDWDPPPGPRQ